MASCRTAGILVRSFSTSTAVKSGLVATPIKLYGVEGRYATALYSAATKEKKLDVVEKEMTKFRTLLQTDSKLADFLKNPTYQRQAKLEAMKKIAESQKYGPISSNFLQLLSEQGRLPKTSSILGAFETMMRAHRGELTCVVTTAKPLDASSQKELRAALGGFAKSGQMQIEMKVDPEIQGGMIVDIGDQYIDMSIASKMKKYTKLIEESV